MATDFIPSTDAAKITFLTQLNSAISSTPTDWGLTGTQATAFQTALNAAIVAVDALPPLETAFHAGGQHQERGDRGGGGDGAAVQRDHSGFSGRDRRDAGERRAARARLDAHAQSAAGDGADFERVQPAARHDPFRGPRFGRARQPLARQARGVSGNRIVRADWRDAAGDERGHDAAEYSDEDEFHVH